MSFTADPDDGRFVTQDTYRGDMNDPGSLHLYAYCANNPVNYVDPSGHRRVRISTWITSLAIDGILTVYAGWWKWGYDLIGNGIRKALNKGGIKTASQKFLGAIPKIKGAYNNFFFTIRKAIWRFTGYTIKIGFSTGMSTALNQIARCFKSKKIKQMTYIVTSLTSLGGAISLGLDYISDRRFDGKITL